MIIRILAVLVAASLLLATSAPVAVAQSDDQWQTDLYSELSASVDVFNANVDNISLGFAGDQLADKRVNLYVNDGDDRMVASFYMDGDNHITDLREEAHPDAQLKMTTDRATVETIVNSNTPAADFRSAVADDRIVISGEDDQFVERVKWGVINLLKGFLL